MIFLDKSYSVGEYYTICKATTGLRRYSFDKNYPITSCEMQSDKRRDRHLGVDKTTKEIKKIRISIKGAHVHRELRTSSSV